MENRMRPAASLTESRYVPGFSKAKRWPALCLQALSIFFIFGQAGAAEIVPTDIMQPGTQPGEASNLESPDKCDNCHGGYNDLVEPAFNWRGSAMGNAGRDPIFWATLAIAEQDFDGAGDLCIRCHSSGGWLGGRSTPTDGSGLAASDDDGVDCDTCHKMTSPDNAEHLGVMNPPFVANDGTAGYYGSGMLSILNGSDKLGPYSDPAARHQAMQSKFHRSVDFCGSCHDVSNPAVGNLAPNNGTQPDAATVTADGSLGGAVDGKAAFNNPPYAYGIVERTFSEFRSGLVSQTRVRDYPNLPADLQGGALQAGYESALVAGTGGDYADGTPRYFSCQTCHLRPVQGAGCNKKGAPVRSDLPLHDMTGGNYWIADLIKYQDSRGQLRLGGGLTTVQSLALDAGAVRAKKQLSEAATLEVVGNMVRVVNQTGHKLITGYPEGRRMWLNIRWYDVDSRLLREDGAWGPVTEVVNPADGLPVQVESLLDLHDPNTKIYEAHYAMTQEWAAALLDLGYAPDMALSYDRVTGLTSYTLGDLAARDPGAYHETFHFVLNNHVAKDNRIPPYGFSLDEAARRNALPVPADQYGNPGPAGAYDYWDELELNPPVNAVYAEIDLVYQGTSWEYVQFLWLANNGTSAFLAAEGQNMLEAWINTGMVQPYVMASTVWGDAPVPPTPALHADSLTTWSVTKQGDLLGQIDVFNVRDTVAIVANVVDEAGAPLPGAQVFLEVRDGGGGLVISLQGFSDDAGKAVLKWKTGRREAPGQYTGNIVDILKNGYEYAATGTTIVPFTLQ